MNFLIEHTEGVFIDHEHYFETVYNKTVSLNGESTKSFCFEKSLFNLKKPYIEQRQKNQTNNTSIVNVKKRRIRKRKYPFSAEELVSQQYYEHIRESIQSSAEVLCGLVKEYFARQVCCGVVTDLTGETYPLQGVKSALQLDFSQDALHFMENKNEFPVRVLQKEKQILMPKSCRFLNCDVSDIKVLIKDCQKVKYNCILMDPPWKNKSVKRGAKYDYLSFYDIKHLPIRSLAENGCLVAIWITNKQKILNFVTNELFPFWNVQYIAKWFWVKVTKSGTPIYPFDSLHKKPYESLVIGRFCLKDGNRKNPNTELFPNYVVCSVPCKIHSHKPPIYSLLERFVITSGKPRCLEMFARNLTPGWTSWGNEVLKLQDTHYYHEL